jgi:hypothetical protein
MRDIRNDHLPDFVSLRHLHSILAWGNDKLEAPQPVFRQSKPPTDSRPTRVAQEPEVIWEEQVVYLLGRVAEAP